MIYNGFYAKHVSLFILFAKSKMTLGVIKLLMHIKMLTFHKIVQTIVKVNCRNSRLLKKLIINFCKHYFQMSEESPEMRATAARICRDYLHGVWKHVTPDNIVLKRIRLVFWICSNVSFDYANNAQLDCKNFLNPIKMLRLFTWRTVLIHVYLAKLQKPHTEIKFPKSSFNL